jgi:hypothetical protein
MKEFLQAHANKIQGTLSCFDRMLFRGYLPIQDGKAMAQFLNHESIRFHTLKAFLLQHAHRVTEHAQTMARKEGRPYEYLPTKVRMEDRARQLAAKDGITDGLICVYRVLQPCRTFSFLFKKGRPFVQPARRKCLFVYFYYMDSQFGLIHIKLQTWFPMVMQVYLNGHEWLARKLTENQIGYTKVDNVLVRVEDLERAQAFSDRLPSLNWPQILHSYARRVNPLLDGILGEQRYYWVTAQSEYSTDVLFRNRAALSELYPRLISHGMKCFGAKEVMSFLGRKLVGQFQGEVVTDVLDLLYQRIPGVRIKHRLKQNFIKMYDKAGVVLRIEMVINSPEDFRVRKSVRRKGESMTEWVPMRKGVGYLFRYRDVSMSANSRYLDALAVVSDPTNKVKELDQVTRTRKNAAGRSARGFNPVNRQDVELFQAVMAGEHHIKGFTNRDLRQRLYETQLLRTRRTSNLDVDPKRQSAKTGRILSRLHMHGLVAKIPRSRRWRTTGMGRRLMTTAIQLREVNLPQLLALAA